ncbi:MAG: iron(III) transport system ATP-binding protein [Candidatus Latescibacterota bacterium]|jgi:iron(III) transport system ATP-binding protein
MVGVTLENVTKRFDNVVALERINLQINPGEFFFLLGPSGCGKTTLLRILAGFYTPEGGHVHFGDRDITLVPPHKRNTGMVFQNYALWPHMTVWKNVEYGLTMRNINQHEKDQRVKRALEMVQMAGYADRSPNQLSGGQQQRVALARALVIEPGVVLMDEPLSNLDARLRLEMREHLQDLHKALGVTIIYVTHDQKEALAMGDRVAVMQMGQIAQIGTPREVYTRPATRFVADFIGEINLIPGDITNVQDTIIHTDLGDIRGATDRTFTKGQRVLCAVRPEALDFLEGEPSKHDNVVSGQVKHVIYLGEVEQYIVELLDGTQVKLVEYDPAEQRAMPGDSVRLKFSSQRVVILPDEEDDRHETV